MLDFLLKLIPHAIIHKKYDREYQDWENYTIPHQLVKLVQQAHRYESFNTDPYISVGADMRQKLMHPLTIEQAKAIGNTDYIIEKNCITYKLDSYAYVKGVLCAVVLVTIEYCDKKKGIDLHYPCIPYYIKCSGNSKRGGFEIISVEYHKQG